MVYQRDQLEFIAPDNAREHYAYRSVRMSEKELIPDVTARPKAVHEDVLILSITGMHKERERYEAEAERTKDMMERLRNLTRMRKLDRVIQDMYLLLL